MAAPASPLSEHLYLQPLEAEGRLLVPRSGFNVPPHASWFYLHLVLHPDTPLGTAEDGLPLYYIPAPRAVVMELVRCATHPAVAKRRMKDIPTGLDKATWLEFMEEYSVTVLDKDPLPAGPPTKRMRIATILPSWFPSATTMASLPDGLSPISEGHGDDLVSGKCAYLAYCMQKSISRTQKWVELYANDVDLLREPLVSAGYRIDPEQYTDRVGPYYKMHW